MKVAWSGFDLINGFNAWKKTEDAGRVVAIDSTGEAEIVVTGLPWRFAVCQQVFEEAAVDCGRPDRLVGLALRQAHRQASRLPAIQEKSRRDTVVSAAQQTSKGPPTGDPGRRQRLPTLDHAAHDRADRRA